MKIIELECDPSLGYGLTKVEGDLDLSFLPHKNDFLLFTASVLKNYTTKSNYIVNGTTRYTREIESDVVLYNIKSTSPFYAQIFWDIAHSLQVGQKIYVYEETNGPCLLEAEYYQTSFKILESNKFINVYQKESLLLCEENKGLDSWTFGIPAGPEDPVFLNKTVKRILQLGFEDFEIIICGKPNKEFKYFDKVKIVGEEIKAPPVHITKKKNKIAEHATKKNLCILHDRVLLPSNFKEAILKFGDLYPIVGFQSYYFSDYYNVIPRKYSDFNTLSERLTKHIVLEDFDKKSTKSVANNFNFYYQNPLRTDFGKDYLTGSLYICKSALWRNYPQNENLFWDDYEDVEFGSRAALKGIPSIINPFTITQSMNARSLLHYYGYISTISKKGKIKLTRSITETVFFGRRKPIFRITEKEAIKKMLYFAEKYCLDESVLINISSSKLTGKGRLNAIIKIVNNLQLPIWQVDEFVTDLNRNILFEAMPPEQQKDMIDYLSSNAWPQDKKRSIVNLPILHNQLSNSIGHSLFTKSSKDWYVKKTIFLILGSWLSAFNLKYLYTGSYLPMSIRELKNIILDTTMFEEIE